MIKILLFVSFKYSNLLEFEGKIWILQGRQKRFTTKKSSGHDQKATNPAWRGLGGIGCTV